MAYMTFEEQCEFYKKLEREGINPFEYAGEPCRDCANCISDCEKRNSTDTTTKVVR